MKKKAISLCLSALLILSFSLLCVAQSDVEITKSMQVVDTLDNVDALYRPGTVADDYGDSTYKCAAYPIKYFKKLYSVSLSGLSENGTPTVTSGKLTVVTDPKKGDLAFWPSTPHSAIVKSVSGDKVILIEQNWKYKSGGKWYATIDRQVSKTSSGLKIYRWSK
ncbi:hypothetical protein LY28_00050 [Ruminiclostridium sufflavum DSM 19573]|uniref:CHAP domain-containing protein n=1 Tax=Ruminiclostridium sufflavum DSM 19573 TaxID=1121337 RepID=A0A318XU58_9FIRM|nr:CHAP domain-containing protein [Ruminiclostridium sufflavum]PYG87735.1 hypothetical protein LY28_01755 [Ruminiclostridium sufflavum DSM 19573]PYG90170.1 hypothetical protein LY28_00050 [Ruminiclostridium sufflavum DSM 19573]